MHEGTDERLPELSLVVARVADLAASQQFYEQVGITFRSEQHGRGPEHLSAALGAVVFELYPLGSGPSTQGLRLGLAVADLRSVAERLERVVVDEHERDGQRVVVVQDPDGHKIEMTQGQAPQT